MDVTQTYSQATRKDPLVVQMVLEVNFARMLKMATAVATWHK